MHTIASELRHRRLSWLQSMARSEAKSASTFAALSGTSIWEKIEELDSEGSLTVHANPWLRQFFRDLQIYARHNSFFRKVWEERKWFAIFSDVFEGARFASVRTYIHEDSGNFLTSDDLLTPAMRRLKPYQCVQLAVDQTHEKEVVQYEGPAPPGPLIRDMQSEMEALHL
eukprot:TRINITY_DN28022_c0_g1_i1.p1 TRINITY_DN28022_c0_g1~~TRINITY_DN28022_c0_g1_i1.p1  ORF type:complete len:170 (+),score=27.17 TRINITY_DN28022_c0_g1_i1:251-760(+)